MSREKSNEELVKSEIYQSSRERKSTTVQSNAITESNLHFAGSKYSNIQISETAHTLISIKQTTTKTKTEKKTN